VIFYKKLDTGHLHVEARVIARRDARGPQPAARTCCLRTTDAENKKETFFGDLFAVEQKVTRSLERKLLLQRERNHTALQ
jgi:hypothetical protein